MLWYSWQDVTTDQVLQPLNCRGPDKMPKRTDQAESTNGGTLVQDPCKGKGDRYRTRKTGKQNSRARSRVRLSASRCQASPVQRETLRKTGQLRTFHGIGMTGQQDSSCRKAATGFWPPSPFFPWHGLWQYCTFFHEERSSEDIHLGRIACTAKVWRPM